MVCRRCRLLIYKMNTPYESGIYGHMLRYAHNDPNKHGCYCNDVHEPHDITKEFRYAQPALFKKYIELCGK